MVYRIIRWLSRFTLKAYFRRIEVRGMENIPSDGPVIIVANHPSAFMDPMVIGICVNRFLHFIAAGEFMGRGLKMWIMSKQLHMIPVYRPSTTTGEASKMNEEMFSKCYELLAGGGAVLIFPEGSSVTEKRVRKLKTGTARIALGTREHSGGVEVSIVPVGLNYANPHRFQSEVFVNIGEPVTTKGFSSDQDGAAGLTAEIERRLRETVLHVQYEELDSVVKKAELIMKSRPGSKREEKDLYADPDFASRSVGAGEGFQFRQRLIQSMHAMHESQPELLREIELRLDAYLGKIRQMGISDSSVAAIAPIDTTGERLRLLGGRPLFLLGFLINALPYYLTVFLFWKLKLFPRPGAPVPTSADKVDTNLGTPKKERVNPAFRGSIAISIGMVVFILWYLGLAMACALLTGLWWTGLVALLAFYLTGLFTLRYIGWTLIADQKSKVRKLLGKGSDLYAELIVERRAVFDSINRMTQEFQTK